MKKVRIYNLLYLTYFYYKELCCSFCYFRDLHLNHNVLAICDEELLKKENITLEASKKEFDDYAKIPINIKEKIEKEIIEIDTLFEKINNEVTKSFELKYEKLKKEENLLKEKLQNETTKVKEKLENYLSECNMLIKINEKINKGIKVIENDKEKNIIKDLSYISKINKTQKRINSLNQELMRNLKISFNEEENNITYEEYYFNGIQVPKDIEFKEIGINSLKVFWKIDNINIKNIDNNQIKFVVEIKEENSKNKFNKVYEGNNTNYLIENLNRNTNYEIRMYSVYNNIMGALTPIKKVKTVYLDYNVDSNILNETDRKNEFLEKIYEWSGYKKMKLIYRGSRDGLTSNDFHNKCDNKGATICLYKNEKGYIFGGYSSIPWTSDGNYHPDPQSFIFTLTNIHGTDPTKIQYLDKENNVYHQSDYGPTFNSDIWIRKNFVEKNNDSDFPTKYKDILGKGRSIFTGDFDNKNNKFSLKEIEVFNPLN